MVCHFLSVRLAHGTLADSLIDNDPLSQRLLRQQLVQCTVVGQLSNTPVARTRLCQ